MAKMRIAPEERARVKLECIRLLSTLRLNRAKMQLILGFVDTYLRLNDEEEGTYRAELDKLTPVERERLMEVTMSWREQALQEGLQQGLQQGKQEGMLSVIIHQIERRFGSLDAGTRERIVVLTPDQLESLGDALLDFSGVEDLAVWLKSL